MGTALPWLFVPILVGLCGRKGQTSQYRSKTEYKVEPTCTILRMAITGMLIEFWWFIWRLLGHQRSFYWTMTADNSSICNRCAPTCIVKFGQNWRFTTGHITNPSIEHRWFTRKECLVVYWNPNKMSAGLNITITITWYFICAETPFKCTQGRYIDSWLLRNLRYFLYLVTSENHLTHLTMWRHINDGYGYLGDWARPLIKHPWHICSPVCGRFPAGSLWTVACHQADMKTNMSLYNGLCFSLAGQFMKLEIAKIFAWFWCSAMISLGIDSIVSYAKFVTRI